VASVLTSFRVVVVVVGVDVVNGEAGDALELEVGWEGGTGVGRATSETKPMLQGV
jgi:hypothetical protein